MVVSLLYSTPLWVCAKAIRKCWASEGKSDTYTYDASCDPDYIQDTYKDGEVITGDKDKALIERVGNKNKHSSTLEHLNYTFDIRGISRACLQELSRHRHASLSVKSTRYTLKELKEEQTILVNDNGNVPLSTSNIKISRRYVVFTGNPEVDSAIITSLANLQNLIRSGRPNDITKFALPEAYKTSLVWTVNARSLQNFLALRTDKAALWEIRDLANEIFKQLPEEHKYLFKDFVKEYK